MDAYDGRTPSAKAESAEKLIEMKMAAEREPESATWPRRIAPSGRRKSGIEKMRCATRRWNQRLNDGLTSVREKRR